MIQLIPKFQYQIPAYDDWFIIVTSNGMHFYFNRRIRKSYWQLHDVFRAFQDINQDEFIKSIGYDEVSLLMARVHGLKGLEVTEKSIPLHKDDNNKTGKNDAEDSIDAEEEQYEDTKPEETNTEEQLSVLNELLMEEGYLNEKDDLPENKDSKKDTPGHEPKNETSDSTPKPAPLISGYSSSEEEDDYDSGDVKSQLGDRYRQEVEQEMAEHGEPLDTPADGDTNDNGMNMNDSIISSNDMVNDDGIKGSDYDSNDDHDNKISSSLDLDLEVDDNGDSDNGKLDFFEMLEHFKEVISIYDDWSLIEEEHINEFIKFPGFFSSDKTQRAQYFNDWCKINSNHEETSKGIYPTETLSYFRVLQKEKTDVRKLFFKEFVSKHGKELTSLSITPKEKENLFRVFKLTINDYTDYEKQKKREKGYDPSINLKVQRLNQFLVQYNSSFCYDVDRTTSDDPWVDWNNLLNRLNLDKRIAENPINFILGDEKRYQSYINAVNSALST